MSLPPAMPQAPALPPSQREPQCLRAYGAPLGTHRYPPTPGDINAYAAPRDAGVRFGNRPDPKPHRTTPGVWSGSGFRCKNVLIFGWGVVRGAAYAVHLMHLVRTRTAPRTVP